MSAALTPAEELKGEKNGLDVLEDIHRWAREGWEAIPPREYDRLRYYGVFYRKATPGYFMMRIRVPGGLLRPGQLRALADIEARFGRDLLDLTTRQAVELRWIRIEDVPEILDRLAAAGLSSLQTGFDNIRNVTGCPVAGLDRDELVDATPLVNAVHHLLVGNRDYTNLPRKMNISITGCRDDCAHASVNDIGLSPATRGGQRGFNLRLAGGVGPWGTQHGWLLGWVEPEQVVESCHHIIEIYRDHGPRAARTRSRLRFLIAEWGLQRFREEFERRAGFDPAPAGDDEARTAGYRDHVGVHPQHQPGLRYVGLLVPTGRLRLDQAFEICRLADRYGRGELRLTTGQNVILPHVPEAALDQLRAEPLLRELSPSPGPFLRGTVSCTGNTFCSFSLIETKARAREVADELDRRLGPAVRARLPEGLRLHVTGCPNSCGLIQIADVGLLGRKVNVGGTTVEGCDVYFGGLPGLAGAFGERVLQNVPFGTLPDVLEGVLAGYIDERRPDETFRHWCLRTGRISVAPSVAAAAAAGAAARAASA